MAMKYKLSKLKDKLNDLGVSRILFLNATNSHYTNEIDMTANQNLGGMCIQHKIWGLTFEDCLVTLLKRAEICAKSTTEIKPPEFEVPLSQKRNMIGCREDGNVILVDDILESTLV